MRTSTPASVSPRLTSSPAKDSIRGNRPERRASSVTDDPSPCHAVAISTATPPPPTTASRLSTSLLSVARRFVHGRASAIPGKSGNDIHIIARGNTIIQLINGRVMSEIIDDDKTARKMDGLIGIQLHVTNAAMKIESRNIRIKEF